MVFALHALLYLIFSTATKYFIDKQSESQRGEKKMFPALSILKVVLLKIAGYLQLGDHDIFVNLSSWR